MADFAFRKQMEALDVDIDTMTIVDQAPPDGAVSLADGSVDMACIFGGASAKAAGEVGRPIMSTQQKRDAGIGSFDVISVTESFARDNPDLVREFLEVTHEANEAWSASNAQISNWPDSPSRRRVSNSAIIWAATASPPRLRSRSDLSLAVQPQPVISAVSSLTSSSDRCSPA